MITVVGESLVDVVDPGGRGGPAVHPGGSPANVAVALARLGQRTVFVTQLGADDYGALIRAHLERNGVELVLAGPASRPTSRALARLDARGAATYEFELSWDVRDPPIAEGSAAVHAGSLGVLLAPGGEQVVRLVEAAYGRGLVTSYDPNVRPSVTPDRQRAAATAERVIASAHVVKMSDEDLDFLFPGMAPGQLAARLLGPGRATQLLVVTRGSEGATVATGAGQFSAAAVPVRVVDTVGAGDAFMAALLAGLADLGELSPAAIAGHVAAGEGILREIAGQALAAAALTCARPGADPPTAGELRRFRANPGSTGAPGQGSD